ncbi:MAG: hypothetical protein NTY53_18605 [Kiritimatiellaeota bacterium]|nr:hypothetical protein [Kiritimatiellota bacterium]
MCNEIERLAVQSGAAVAFGAHFAKGNASSKDAIDRISGSGVWARDPDAVMVATPHQEADAFTVECRLRNHAPLDPFCIRWEFPLMRRDGELDPADLKKSKGGREAEHEPEEIAALLCAAALTTSDWRDAAAKQLGVSESTFYRLRKTAEVRGIARKNSMTHKWELKK